MHRHRTTARRNAAANTECTSLGASDADTCAVLIEEGTATLTKLRVRRVLLSDLGEERERSLVGVSKGKKTEKKNSETKSFVEPRRDAVKSMLFKSSKTEKD